MYKSIKRSLTVECYRKNVFFFLLKMEQLLELVNVCQYFSTDSNASSEISLCTNKWSLVPLSKTMMIQMMNKGIIIILNNDVT